MSRTDEQIQADDALTGAIERCRAAYMEPSDRPQMLTDYLVIVAAQQIGEDGDSESVYDLLFRDGSIPDHAARGLLAVAERLLTRMEDPDGSVS